MLCSFKWKSNNSLPAANETLSCIKGVCGVGDSLSFSGHAHQSLTVGGKCANGGGGTGTLSVLDNLQINK